MTLCDQSGAEGKNVKIMSACIFSLETTPWIPCMNEAKSFAQSKRSSLAFLIGNEAVEERALEK